MDRVEAGTLKRFIDKLMDSFFKSLGDIFGDADSKITSERGKIIVEPKVIENEVLDENGKKLSPNTNVFEYVLVINWPKEDPLTRKAAEAFIKNELKDGRGDRIWKDAKSIELEMQFRGKNRVSKKVSNKNQFSSELRAYMESDSTGMLVDGTDENGNAMKINITTKMVKTVIFLFNEIDENKESNQEDASSSNRLNIALKKVVGDTDVDIQLIKINANYDILSALHDVETIVSDDAFLNQLPDDETVCYSVDADESDYDVNECEDFDCIDTIQQVIFETFSISNKIKMLGLLGLKYIDGRSILDYDSLSYSFDQILKVLSDALFDLDCLDVPNFEVLVDKSTYPFEDLEDNLLNFLKNYLEILQVVCDCLSIGNRRKLENLIVFIEELYRSFKQK